MKVNGKEAYRWVKRRPRNEVLDNRNYALHAAFGLGLHNYTDKRWSDLEASVQPAVDLFTPPPASLRTALDSKAPSFATAHAPARSESSAANDVDVFSPISLA
ncbi:Phage terminase large subunit [compost metagenome]